MAFLFWLVDAVLNLATLPVRIASRCAPNIRGSKQEPRRKHRDVLMLTAGGQIEAAR
jgi:hypothetical protein